MIHNVITIKHRSIRATPGQCSGINQNGKSSSLVTLSLDYSQSIMHGVEHRRMKNWESSGDNSQYIEPVRRCHYDYVQSH